MSVFSDRQKVEQRMGIIPETKSVARFVPSDSIFKLDLCFDVEKLRASLADCLEKVGYANNEWKAQGFGILPLNHRADDNDLKFFTTMQNMKNMPQSILKCLVQD